MKIFGQFPQTRLRRLRTQPWLRDMVQENRLHPSDLILPLFIRTPQSPAEISAMPGVRRWTIAELPQIIDQIVEARLPAVALFPLTPEELKTPDGKEALNPDNLICQAIRKFKEMAPHLGIIADVALDPYTNHGHDGIWDGRTVENDLSLEQLAKQAIVQADAGADILAPSDMMDGRVGVIRHALDAHDHQDKAIMSYAAKYASSYYGPFREAVGAATLPGQDGQPKGDKRTYQLNAGNADEALREVALDIQEGADMFMVKPGLPYLDIVHRVSQTFQVPTFVYQISGEYSMIKAGALQGWLDEEAAMEEALLSMKRAGAKGILTYAALEVAKRLK